jgi:DNA gyrase subunit B
MPELVRSGKIYIACPPLYKMKRKKREEYVDDDIQLNRILISLGADEVKLKNLSDNRTFNSSQLTEILSSLEKLAKYSDAVRRHGGDFEQLLKHRNPATGALPTFLVRVREGNNETVRYFSTEEQVREFHLANQDLGLFEIEQPAPVEGGDAVESTPENPVPQKAARKNDGPRRRGRLVELHEAAPAEKLLAELGKKGLRLEHYSNSDQPLFEIVEGDGEKATTHPLFTIPEILQKVIEIGRKGMTIQRFKGLGEMNAKELFETTMNPEKRRLLKVDLNETNALEADKMFTVLMGDIVEPRRQFIEDNALNVRNLDV